MYFMKYTSKAFVQISVMAGLRKGYKDKLILMTNQTCLSK